MRSAVQGYLDDISRRHRDGVPHGHAGLENALSGRNHIPLT
jgi:hypothetical protein